MKEIKLKTQSKWIVRAMFGLGAVAGLGIAFYTYPMGGTNAQNCVEGYKENDFGVCINENAGIYNDEEKGLIKITDGEDNTIYVKDKDQGAIQKKNNILVQFSLYYYKLLFEGLSEDEVKPLLLEYCEGLFGRKFEDYDGLVEYIISELVNIDPESVGTYYFWGNNSGVNYDDFVLSDDYEYSYERRILNTEYLVEQGGADLSEEGLSRWSVGSDDTPCDASKGEYLPSVDDRRNLIIIGNYIYDGSNNYDDDLNESIMLLGSQLNAGTDYIHYNHDDYYLYNEESFYFTSNSGGIGLVYMEDGLFPVLEEFRVSNFGRTNDATHVRCFVKPEYVPSYEPDFIATNTVTFETNGGNTIDSRKVRVGHNIKNIRDPEREGYKFIGWYTDRNLTQEFDINTPITSDITLYAKRLEYGVIYMDGMIKVTDGEKTYYIKDRNQGATVSQGLSNYGKLYLKREELQNKYDNSEIVESFLLEYGNELYGIDFDNFYDLRDYAQQPYGYQYNEWMEENCQNGCTDEESLNKINEITNQEFIDLETAEDYVYSCDKYNPVCGEANNKSFGTYYYRGNNYGVTFNDLNIDWKDYFHVNLDESLVENGFDGPNFDNIGWKEGNIGGNPCDTSKGEYLPTPEQWREVVEIYGEVNGYEINIDTWERSIGNENFLNYEIVFEDDYLFLRFADDLLIPSAGLIDDNRFEDVGYEEFYMWMASDREDNIGFFGGEELEYTNKLYYENNEWRRNQATPIRCFVDESYITNPENYVTITFETNGGSEVSPEKVKKGTNFGIGITPKREGYKFIGWYKDSELIQEFDFENDLVYRDTTLYAKWNDYGIFYTGGMIRITDGLRTYYIKDRNQGATVAQGIPESVMNQYLLNSLRNGYNNCGGGDAKSTRGGGMEKSRGDGQCMSYEEMESELLQYANTLMGNKFSDVNEVHNYMNNPNPLILEYDYWFRNTCYDPCGGDPHCGVVKGGSKGGSSSRGNTDGNLKECTEEDELDAINEITNKNFTDYYEARDYVNNYNPYDPEYGEMDINGYGTYYFWGNNIGVNYDELEFNDLDNENRITNVNNLIANGFDGGKIGWIEGYGDTPCDASKGEYLPSVTDWKKAMSIWSDVKGYTLYDEDNGNDNGNIKIVDNNGEDMGFLFYNDIMFSNAGYIEISNEQIFPGDLVSGGDEYYAKSLNVGDIITVEYHPESLLTQTLLGKNGLMGDFSSMGYNPIVFNYGKLIDYLEGMDNQAFPVRCFVKKYTVRFVSNGGTKVGEIEIHKNGTIEEPETPSKDNAVFKGRYSDPELTQEYDFSTPVTSDIVLYAKWETRKETNTSTNTNSTTSTLKKDKCPNGDYSDSYYDGKCGRDTRDDIDNRRNEKKENERKENQHSSSVVTRESPYQRGEELEYDIEKYNAKYSYEMNEAYQYSYYYGITTRENIEKANMDGNLTRAAMAKMLSQYAINVLGMEPDKTRQKVFKDVSTKMDADYDNGITLSYQLGIMGINMGENFRPNDLVTRGQFVTALSRMKYGTSDGKDIYYSTHMNLLQYLGIIKNADPKMLEKRGYVMLMLMRSGDE